MVGNGDLASDGDVPVGAQAHAAAAFSESARLEREHRHDGECVVQLEKDRYLGRHLGLAIGLGRTQGRAFEPRRSRRSCRAMESVAAAEARMRTGRAANWRASEVGHSTTAAAPSHTGELSSRFTGSAIIFAAPNLRL